MDSSADNHLIHMNLPFCPACLQPTNGLSVCAHCGWYADIKTDPTYLVPGTVINPPYQVARVLGHGGFGVTYLGWDANLAIKVAIKEYLPRDFARRDPHGGQVLAHSETTARQFQAGLTRFLDEARTLAKFQQHPGIVSVLSFFPAFGTGYMVMEYVEGQTLQSYLNRRGRLNWTQTLDIFMQIMDALRAVHKAGLLHSDIAPDNIYLCSDGRIKLLDFGAAQSNFTGQQAGVKTVMVKPGFAPDEQYRDAGQRGPWSDVYSVAASMYFCLTGQIPPDAPNRLKRDTLKPPSAWGISLPAEAEQVLLSALAVESSQRPQSIESLQSQLMQQACASATTAVKALPEPDHEREREPTSVASERLAPALNYSWLRWGLIGATCIFLLMQLFGGNGKPEKIPLGEPQLIEQALESEIGNQYDDAAWRLLREREQRAAEELKQQQAAALRRFEEQRQREVPAAVAKAVEPSEARQSEHMRSLCDEWGVTMDCQERKRKLD